MKMMDDKVYKVVENIWLSTLGLNVHHGKMEEIEKDSHRFRTGCVKITGAWEGTVSITCSEPLLGRIASVMFGVEGNKVEPGHVDDALGEVSNMIGGNIKTLLPRPSFLSLPASKEGMTCPLDSTGVHALSRVAFNCEGYPFLVTLMKEAEK